MSLPIPAVYAPLPGGNVEVAGVAASRGGEGEPREYDGSGRFRSVVYFLCAAERRGVSERDFGVYRPVPKVERDGDGVGGRGLR